MFSRCTAALTTMALLIASSIAQAPAQDEIISRKGAHFVIAVHAGKCKPELATVLADEALAAAERAWPVIEKTLGVRSCKPTTIHLWCDVGQFRAVERDKFKAKMLVEAFGQPDGLESHVLLWPQVSPRVLERIGLPSTTAQNVILMAGQSVVAQQLTAQQTDPWVVDVIAVGLLEAVTNPGHQFGIDVAYDSRRYWVDGKGGRSQAADLRTLLRYADIDTRSDWESRQGDLAMVAQLLAADDAAWARKLLTRLRTRKSSVALEDARVAGVEAVLGADWARSQHKFAKLCSAVRPVWEESAPLMVQQGKRWLLVGSPQGSSSVYCAEPPPPGDYVLSATIEIEAAAAEPEIRVQFDWNDADLVGLLLVPSGARLAFFSTSVGKWETLVEKKARIAAGTPFDLKVEVTKAQLRVLVDGIEILAWDCSGRDMHGRWSVATGDAMVWLEGLKVEPLAPAKK